MFQGIETMILPRATGIADAPEKSVVIRLRWPLILLCSYLLLYSDEPSLLGVKGVWFIYFYIFSNGALYFIDDELFRSPYFYVPLVVFDTLCLAIAAAVSGPVSVELYIAFFLTIILCCIARDLQGFLSITILGPVLYGSFLLKFGEAYDPTFYLRLPFPFVTALFYGYFVQVEQAQERLKEQLDRQHQIQGHRDRQAALHEINLAITSTLDLRSVLGLLLEKVETLLPYPTVTTVALIDRETGELKPIACRNLNEAEWKHRFREFEYGFANSVIHTGTPLIVDETQVDPRLKDRELAARNGLFSYLGTPLIAKNRTRGVLAIYTKGGKRLFSGEEVEFVTALAGQAAVAILNSQLHEESKKQAFEFAQLNEELERASRVKSEFLGVMSHELRTPLNVIMGYTGIIQDKMLGDINKEQEKTLGIIFKQSHDLLAMIASILSATQLEAGAVKIEIHQVNLGQLLDDIRLAYHVPLDKEVTLNWDYPPHFSVVKTDSDKIKHILQNLVNNAIKFTRRGTVTISAMYFPETETVEFKVADTGIGIPKEELPFLFDMFRQLDSSDTRFFGGVGLGLYIVKKFTDKLNGKIQVESEPEKGTTFTVTIPVKGANYENGTVLVQI